MHLCADFSMNEKDLAGWGKGWEAGRLYAWFPEESVAGLEHDENSSLCRTSSLGADNGKVERAQMSRVPWKTLCTRGKKSSVHLL